MKSVMKHTLIYFESKLFYVSKFLGLFASHPSRKRNVHLSNAISAFISTALLTSQCMLWWKTFLQRQTELMNLVYQGYAIISLLVTFLGLSSQFQSLLNRNFRFIPTSTHSHRPNSAIFMVPYLALATLKISGIIFVLFITRSDNLTGLVTFVSFVVLSIEEIFMFLILVQMYELGCTIATSIEKVRTSTSSIQTKFECLMKFLEISESLNRFYERQVLFSLAYLLLLMVNSGYYAAMYILVKPVLLNYRYYMANCIVNLIVTVEAFVPLSVPVSACEKINNAVNAFYEELFTIVRKSDELCRNKKLGLYLTLRRTVNFRACGFFDLGYPLITSIIAAATTYLVILIQFSYD